MDGGEAANVVLVHVLMILMIDRTTANGQPGRTWFDWYMFCQEMAEDPSRCSLADDATSRFYRYVEV